MRLIDADAAIDVVSKALKGVFVEYQDVAEKMIGNVPTAEPQIIRCKDCKHWDTSDIHSTVHPNRRCKGVVGKLYTDERFYCAYAERRQDG